MENITVIVSEIDGSENVIIDKGNGEITGMPKSVYDEQLAAQSTPPVVE